MNIASYIDHTILKQTTQRKEIEQLCKEASEHGFAAICVPPSYVDLARKTLQKKEVKIATVVGFPFGYTTLEAKAEETKQCLMKKADEIDMVAPIYAIMNEDWAFVEKEIAAIEHLVHREGAILKVIIESGILSDGQIVQCCNICASIGVDFVKTSTGFAEKGASTHAVALMRKHLPAAIKIKASGGIRSYDMAMEMIAAGADRLGCSASVQIIQEATINAN